MEPRFSVAEFNDVINKTLQAVGDVVVEGEITQLGVTAKGGVNIVIKDPTVAAVLNLSGYAPRIEGLKFIKEGMKVAAWGIPALWSQGGKFSLQIYKILPLGEGALKEAYEQLKRQLAAEGLFAEERKRPLPEVITRVALLTGRDSAAQSDFLKILRENQAGINVDYYPVQVQGKYAEKEILGTLKYADAQGYDCVVLVRGGGSLEDLITFNSEKLARLLFSMRTPVVVGIGHERDESIADYVADVRASTPSQAAYYLVTNNNNYVLAQEQKVEFIKAQLERNLNIWKLKAEKGTAGIMQKLLFQIEIVKSKAQKLRYLIQQLPLQIEQNKQKLTALERLLKSLDPQNVLQRGYSIIKNEAGTVITSSKQTKVGENIAITLKHGKLLSNILKINND